MKKLTVVIPLYNQQQYIEQCLKSVLNQNFKDIEVLVIDDGSTDDSFSICNRIAQSDYRVRIIHQENKGLSEARKTGIINCNTEYITFVDADDFILKNAYEYASEAMEKDIDMIFFEIARYYDDSNIKIEHHILNDGYYDKMRIEQEVYPRLIWDFKIGVPGIECSQCVRIMKKAILQRAYETITEGGFYYGDDVAITYPSYLLINNMQVINHNYYMHRQRCNGIAPYIKRDSFFKEAFDLYNYLIDVFEDSNISNIKKQIEYFFIYSVNLKKMKYNDYVYEREFLFPFDKVANGKKIVLYGAGNVGKTYYKQLTKIDYCNEIYWIDKNAEYMSDKRIQSIDYIDNIVFDYVVIAIENVNICDSVKDWLISRGIDKDKIIYKE
mgnify:CR=1 FL=1